MNFLYIIQNPCSMIKWFTTSSDIAGYFMLVRKKAWKQIGKFKYQNSYIKKDVTLI